MPRFGKQHLSTTLLVMFLFDAHLDLAMNALEWNRDLTRPIEEIRQREARWTDKPDRGRGTVCLPEMRRGAVGLCVATLIARYVKPSNPLPGWHSPEQAWAQTQGQLAWYRAMEEAGHLVQIKDTAGLEDHLKAWHEALPSRASASPIPTPEGVTTTPAVPPPIGYILSLEGADSLVTLRHLERAYAQGLRAVGPAHYGPGTYAHGTDASGGIGPRGRELLREMQRLGVILDVTHLCERSFWEALDAFSGPVWASHSNCRALTPHERQLDDDQIRYLVRRGAVIGIALDAWMLVPGWVRGHTTPDQAGVTLARVVDHIDHICQLTGDARHVGIGSDLDGGFGREQCPADLNTIADLARLEALLQARGYREPDIAAILHGNFIRFLRTSWR
jgi:membrane dipeptidase